MNINFSEEMDAFFSEFSPQERRRIEADAGYTEFAIKQDVIQCQSKALGLLIKETKSEEKMKRLRTLQAKLLRRATGG